MFPTVILSAGHEPYARGAEYEGLNEHEICVQLCFYAAAALHNTNEPTAVVLVPPDNLHNKILHVNLLSTVLAKDNAPHFAVEIHCNTAALDSARGVEVFYYKEPGPHTNSVQFRMAKRMIGSIAVLGWPSRGPKTHKQSHHTSLGWVAKTKCTALLVEVGFLTNHHDRSMLGNPTGRATLGQRIANGIQDAALMLETKEGKDTEVLEGEHKAWREGRSRIGAENATPREEIVR